MSEHTAALGPTGPYRAEFGAILHANTRGFLFAVQPPAFAEEVALALNVALVAPDLLAALILAREMLTDEADIPDTFPADLRAAEVARVRQVDAAIAKATGQ